MTHPDLRPATDRMAGLLTGVRDDQLGLPTPCPDYTLGDLVDHILGLTEAFTLAASKDTSGDGQPPPPGDVANLAPDWRTTIPTGLTALAEAWSDPEAWTGMTAAGGIEMPGEIAGLVALDEVLVHGWDVARSIGADYDADEAELQAALDFIGSFPDDSRGEAFGPPVDVPADAVLLDQVIAASGRDPGWRPA